MKLFIEKYINTNLKYLFRNPLNPLNPESEKQIFLFL